MVSQIVNRIDEIIRTNEWFDFHILNYDGRKLKVAGGKDLLYYHTLEITFTDIFFIHGFFETWRTDTKDKVFITPEDKSICELNLKFEIEQGYKIFIFKTEDYENDVYIAAKEVNYEEKIVKYYKE